MEVLGAILIVVVFILECLMMAATMAYIVITYVFPAVSMQRIAARRGIRYSWLAWLPVGHSWVLGSISDQYQQAVKGRSRCKRKVLPIMEGGMFALVLLVVILALLFGLSQLSDAGIGDLWVIMPVILVIAYLAIIGLCIVYTVIYYITLYDLYASCMPSQAVLFLILSIAVSACAPFLIFSCRKKDLGMPPPAENAP